MKKIIFICISYIIVSLSSILYANTKASSQEYTTFSEIMMPQGKLMANFTQEEYEEMYENIDSPMLFGVRVYKENSNIDASYISNTLYSVENKGLTDVTYEIEVEVETTNKVSFNANGSLNGSASGTTKGGVKGEIGAKCGVEVSNTTTTSRTEQQKMILKVEANSRAIVYLTGSITITNGVASYYIGFIEIAKGGFEIVTLKNQYARVEKVQIWKK